MNLLVINGPNLSRLDLRDSQIYGNFSYPELTLFIENGAAELGMQVEIRQSDQESEIIGWLHEAAEKSLPVILNPAAFTHYSYAIRDAAAMVKSPLIEVHLSNPMAREEFRHTSVISGIATGTIAGFGPHSYILALQAMKSLLQKK